MNGIKITKKQLADSASYTLKKKMFILKQRMFRRLSVQFISCLIPIEHGLC